MIHPFQHIVDLSEILFQRGVAYVVVSPGSRNAPLINAFYHRFKNNCISIVDERSAAYVGLGLARQSNAPIAILCTSGTAVLNYSPALAEAYYQNIPLIAITADRPAEWIDQQDNQTIRQKNVYQNFVKASHHLKESYDNNNELKDYHQAIHNAFNISSSDSKGPVHINVPLREPLYVELPKASGGLADYKEIEINSDNSLDDFFSAWNHATRIMLLHGHDPQGEELLSSLNKLSTDKRVVCIAENVANIYSDSIIESPDLLIARTEADNLPQPGLLIYSGGQVVSRRLKKYLRSVPELQTWRIGKDKYPMDTFKQNNKFVSELPTHVYQMLCEKVQEGEPVSFKANWHKTYNMVLIDRDTAAKHIPFSDASVVRNIIAKLPSKVILELGNSSIVRVAQLCNSRDGLKYHSNRGVSGIDGCVSSAVGTAMATKKLTVAVVGDLSFLYDSNGLWNKHLPDNFRLIVINNSGGGIFGLLPGPPTSEAFEDFFLAHHPVDIKKLVEAYNLSYFCAKSQDELENHLPEFLDAKKGASVLEVFTEQGNNKIAFKKLLRNN